MPHVCLRSVSYCMSDILIWKLAEMLSPFMSKGIENKLGVTRLHISCKWELISYLWSYVSFCVFCSIIYYVMVDRYSHLQEQSSANTVFAFMNVTLLSLYLNVQTLIWNVKPTFDPITVIVEGNIVVLTIMLSYLKVVKEKWFV